MPATELILDSDQPECKLEDVMGTLRFRPVKQMNVNEVVTFILDCTPRLPTGVTITTVTGTASSVTLGATGTSGLTLSGLAATASDITSLVDGRTITTAKALYLTVNTVAAKSGKRYEILISVKLSNNDVFTMKMLIDVL